MQSTQLPDPAVLYDPASQAVQESAPAPENRPSSQVAQPVFPTPEEYFPSSQLVHEADAGEGEKLPAGQLVQPS